MDGVDQFGQKEEDRRARGGVQRRFDAGQSARPDTGGDQARYRRGDRERRSQPGFHLFGRAGISAAVRSSDHPDQAANQPRLRGEPEGGLQPRHRARAGHRRHAARRWPVRTRIASRDPGPAFERGGRRRLRVAHHGQGRSTKRRDAALQIRGKPNPLPLRERGARAQTSRNFIRDTGPTPWPR